MYSLTIYFKTEEEKENFRRKMSVEKKEALTEKQLFAWNKAEQVSILKEFGVKKIPRLEKDRVKLILEVSSKC